RSPPCPYTTLFRSHERAKPGHAGAHAVVGRVGDVERPVARSTVGLVERVARGVHHGAVGVVAWDPGQLLFRGTDTPVLQHHLRGGRTAPTVAATPVLHEPATVDPLWIAGHGEFDAASRTRRGAGPGEPLLDRGGHGAHGRQRGCGTGAFGAEQRHAEAVTPQAGVPDGDDTVHVDPRELVPLSLDRGAVDVGFTVGPPGHRVPRRMAPRVGAGLQLDGQPRTRRCRGVPRDDEFGGVEREAVFRRGPPGVLAGVLHPGGGADPKSVTGHLGPRRFTVSEPRLAAPFVVLDVH